MARRVYRAADRVVALSPDMAKVIAGWGVPAASVTVVPNASDLGVFGTPETEAGRPEWRDRLGWTNQLVAVHAGAMGAVNGLDYLLDAGAWLDARGATGVRILLLGDGAHRARLQARIDTEQLRSVAIHPPVPKREVPFWVAAADVGIVTVAHRPFLEMNSANKFFDTLAAGRPVLLNYGGWQAQALRESGAGLDADPADPSTFARELIALRDDPERRAAMGRAARRLAENGYDRDKLARELEAVLAAAVREGRSRSAGITRSPRAKSAAGPS
jgi:glycosyltransferase involved in cell wall biosynthesis